MRHGLIVNLILKDGVNNMTIQEEIKKNCDELCLAMLAKFEASQAVIHHELEKRKAHNLYLQIEDERQELLARIMN